MRRGAASAQLGVDALRRRGDRRADATGVAVGLEGQRAPVATLPGRQQRVGEQRQRSRPVGDLAKEQFDQAGLEPQPEARAGSTTALRAPYRSSRRAGAGCRRLAAKAG